MCVCVHMFPCTSLQNYLRSLLGRGIIEGSQSHTWGYNRLWILKDQVEAKEEELHPCGALYDLSREPLGLLPRGCGCQPCLADLPTPCLHPTGFANILKILNKDSSREELLSFIQQFGSHYIAEALYGSEFSCTIHFPSKKVQQQLWLQYQKGEEGNGQGDKDQVSCAGFHPSPPFPCMHHHPAGWWAQAGGLSQTGTCHWHHP